MRLLWVCLAVSLWASPGLAGVYHAGSKCKPLSAHVPDANVAAIPGQDQHGRQVVPADLNAPPVDMEALKRPPIALHLPIDAYLKTDSYNADLSHAEIEAGTITQDAQGGLSLNGNPLSTGQQLYPEECQ